MSTSLRKASKNQKPPRLFPSTKKHSIEDPPVVEDKEQQSNEEEEEEDYGNETELDKSSMFYRNLNYVTSSLDPSKLGSGFEEKSHEFTGFSKQLLRFFQLLSEQYCPDRINLYHAAYSITPSSDEKNEYTPFSKTPNFTPVVLPHPDSLDFDQI